MVEPLVLPVLCGLCFTELDYEWGAEPNYCMSAWCVGLGFERGSLVGLERPPHVWPNTQQPDK